ncbi:MAG: AAA family ATPase [Myxococcales bacterium]
MALGAALLPVPARAGAAGAADAGAAMDAPAPSAEPAETRLPAASPTSSQETLAAHLESLLAGQLPAEVDPRTLFTVPLHDEAAVRQQALHLATLLEETERAHADLQAQQAAALRTKAQAPRPEVLDRPPVAPAPPALPEIGEPPAPPTPPSASRPKRMSAAQRKEWERYDGLLAAYEQQRADYESRRKAAIEAQRAHEAAVAEHEAALKAFEEAKVAYEAALAEAEQRRVEQLARLEASLADSALRLRVLRARKAYLDRLTLVFDAVGAPALRSLATLGEQRTALREYSARLRTLGAALARLRERLAKIELRARTGELVGFLVEREGFEQKAGELGARLARAVEGSGALADELDALAAALEAEGREAQGAILRGAAAGLPATSLDSLFLERVREMRQQRRLVKGQQLGRSSADIDALVARLDTTLERPEALGTFSEAGQELGVAGERQLEAMAVVEARSTELARWRLAFSRQAIAALEPLASPQARSEAYALSVALLGELQDEAAELVVQLRGWASARGARFSSLVSFADQAASWSWLLRLGLVFAGIGALAAARPRIPAATAWTVRRATRVPGLRRRVGGVVRWAGLFEAVVPTLVVIGAGYLFLWILGLDLAEVQIVEVVFRWTTAVIIGRQVLLGLTQRTARGRPALIKARPATVALLRLTYGRLGGVLGVAGAGAEIGGRWLVGGRLRLIIDLALLLGVSAWGIWACLAWRLALAERLAGLGGRWAGIAAAMRERRLWSIASPLAVAALAGRVVARAARRLVEERGLATYLRARELQRLARKSGKDSSREAASASTRLPPAYLQHFPLYPILGTEEAAVVERETALAPMLAQIAQWRETHADGSLVLAGEKGLGKSTLCGLLRRRLVEQEAVFHTLASKALDEKCLVAQLAGSLGAPSATTVAELTTALRAGPRRVVIIDEAHNCFLRTVGGHRGFDALVQLVNATSEHVFWVLVFNRFSWQFLNASRRREHYFRRVLELPRWSAAELQELISLRNARSGFGVRFDELLLDDEAESAAKLELIEGADGFFRLLWESSRGNPRVATHLWLSALRRVDEKTLEVGLFRGPDPAAFGRLGPDLWFALAAICQHENLNADELAETLNVGVDFAGYACQVLREYGLVEPKRADPRRLTLAPRFYNQILDRLRAKHLLFEG